MNDRSKDPHRGLPVLTAGKSLDKARGAVLLVHGRGASAHDIMGLAGEMDRADFAYLAPQAAGNTWYPYGFMSPLAQNEPWLSSALGTIDALLSRISEYISLENTIIAGFSQGACLCSEYVARNAMRYGGLAAFSGGLIGPDDTPRDYAGSLEGTPVFFGCSDVDFHIPKERVLHSAQVLERIGGDVTTRLYPNMGHTINQDEIDFLKGMLDRISDQRT